MDNPRALLSLMIGEAISLRASDILIARGAVSFRIHGDVVSTEFPANDLLYDEILSAQPNASDVERSKGLLTGPEGAVDFAITVGGHRLRANLYRCHEGLSAALRPLAQAAFNAEALGISPQIVELVLNTRSGLVLVNGPTGSGKSTTLNCLVEQINACRADNIITIEEPIEYLYRPKKSTIQQREVGKHVNTFSEALRAALRESPNVIVLGEIRDYPTLSAALQGAETGHLVIGTLHTSSATNTVSRLVNMVPNAQQNEIRSVMASVLRLILCQRLFKRCDEPGRVAAREILINNTAVASLIRDGKDHQIASILPTHRSSGMMDWACSIRSLYEAGMIDEETFIKATTPEGAIERP